ncbi:hypothetical protein [Sphingobium sp. LB126]|uniref:hypothetical protein n=1 Tax=Sphingobium sp. LB126 TaxID=1983755 RepID=UPI0018D506FC|nr:hypothetical protein [Sphingobium sp. LB126]
MMPIAYAHEPYNITTPSTAAASPTDAALTVTGEKSSRSLRNTPTSVTILTSRAIDRQGLISTYDILDRIPKPSSPR